MSKTIALGLFSGGLDSILACRVVGQQGIDVIGLKFVTPFFDYKLLGVQEEYKAEVLRKYGIKIELVDLSEGYIKLLDNPVHGFGKNFNPCVDCKILMMTRARKLMGKYGASFLVSGEVIGQRPMSQRRDTLRVIERDSGCDGILVRPLCAKNMEPTTPEREGLLDRSKLYGFSGRGRKPQIRLAGEFGLKEYPNAAGGCTLTDKNLAKRIKNFYSGKINLGTDVITANDINCLLVGRQFLVDNKYWVIIGRDSSENDAIAALCSDDDWLFGMTTRPGPKALLRYGNRLVAESEKQTVMDKIGGMVVRYGKHINGERPPAEVFVDMGMHNRIETMSALTDDEFKKYKID